MTEQEMFNLAVRGLAKQGWTRALDDHNACVYDDGAGRRCAFGHVDPSLEGTDDRTVPQLALNKVGVAATLSIRELNFAGSLQDAHDWARGPEDMAERFVELADAHSLTWPSDVPRPVE